MLENEVASDKSLIPSGTESDSGLESSRWSREFVVVGSKRR